MSSRDRDPFDRTARPDLLLLDRPRHAAQVARPGDAGHRGTPGILSRSRVGYERPAERIAPPVSAHRSCGVRTQMRSGEAVMFRARGGGLKEGSNVP